MPDLLLRNVRPWPRVAGGRAVDLTLRSGRIAAVDGHDARTPLSPSAGVEVVDGGGGALLPALVDAHAHLDSTRFGLPFRPHTAAPGLLGLVENDRANWRSDGSVAARATRTLGATIAFGATVVRSHAQVDTDCGLERLEGVLAARETHSARCRVQVVAFPQSGILRDPGTADLLDAALSAGADLVGGIDPCAFDRDPVGQLDIVFGLAERHHAGVDIHLHEPGELGAFTIELVAERTAALDMRSRVTISHAFALSGVDDLRQAQLLELLAANDIAVTSVAPGTREPLPLAALRAAGVRVGFGQDGIRDFWSPYGTGDLLDRAWQQAFRCGYRHDELVELCVDGVARGGRSCIENGGGWSDVDVIDDPVAGLAVGAVADLMVLPADTVTAAVMDRPVRSLVIRAGRIVARDGELI